MLEQLKEKVLKANLDLVKYNLVILTWGNVSAKDAETNLVVIKPSGVVYENMQIEDIVVVDLNGNVVEGKLNPSSDTPTHLELYKAFPNIGGITHTHSTYATAFAQSGRDIPFYGTTHADYFYGDIPCTRALTMEEVASDYEKNTGTVIIEKYNGANPLKIPAILVKSHGLFSFGKDANNSVCNAYVAENVAKLAMLTEKANKDVKRADECLLDKHYNRKHGDTAYYGQESDELIN